MYLFTFVPYAFKMYVFICASYAFKMYIYIFVPYSFKMYRYFLSHMLFTSYVCLYIPTLAPLLCTNFYFSLSQKPVSFIANSPLHHIIAGIYGICEFARLRLLGVSQTCLGLHGATCSCSGLLHTSQLCYKTCS